MMPKVLPFVFVLTGYVSASETTNGTTLVNDPDRIRQLNSVPGSTWIAGHNDFFGNMSVEEARGLFGAMLSNISEHLDECLDETIYSALKHPIPADFDARTKWPGLIHPIRNQKSCGSCWAFSSSDALADRVAIHRGKPSPALSPEDMVSCDAMDNGCSGGTLRNAWNYLKHHGVVKESCFPYTASRHSHCRKTCVDSEHFVKTKAATAYAINGVTNMQKEIMTHGPIQVAFEVYASFMSYKSGVYSKHAWEKKSEGGHAVKILGWGVQKHVHGNKKHYWLVANSWGTTWGMNGFFKIVRGRDACSIETRGPPYAGTFAADIADITV